LIDPGKIRVGARCGSVRDSLVDKVSKVIYILSLIGKGKLMADANRSNEAYLGPGTKINGKLFFDGPTTIEGDVEGEITGQANVTIGQQATVKGKITAASIVVQGKVMEKRRSRSAASPGSEKRRRVLKSHQPLIVRVCILNVKIHQNQALLLGS
jgi:hypothetical protein